MTSHLDDLSNISYEKQWFFIFFIICYKKCKELALIQLIKYKKLLSLLFTEVVNHDNYYNSKIFLYFFICIFYIAGPKGEEETGSFSSVSIECAILLIGI